MEQWEWAWLAGIYEGEGTLAFAGKTCVQVRIGMTDKDVIDTIQQLFPANPWRREMKHRIKPLHIWQVNERDKVKAFLEGVLPYLHARRKARALEALGRLARNPGARDKRTHCIRGHPLSGDNLDISRTTQTRHCVTCRREYDLRRNAAQKEQRRLAREARQR